MYARELEIKPSIFEYSDYRLFLSDIYRFYKETTGYFSFRYFSKKAGFNSPNYLKLVIDGKRNLSTESSKKFCDALKLNKEECDFFCKLVEFNQAGTPSERAESALTLAKSKIYKKLKPLIGDQLSYYEQWYQIGVREYFATKDASNDPAIIAKQFTPELNAKDVELAIETLVNLGMLTYDGDGKIIQCEKSVATNNEVSSSLVTLYHKNMIERAKESIDIHHRDERDISAVCISLSEETYAKIKHRIQEFRKELIAIAEEEPNPERVYQLNMQAFPLTKKRGTDDQ